MSFYSGTYALSAMWGGKAAVGGATGGVRGGGAAGDVGAGVRDAAGVVAVGWAEINAAGSFGPMALYGVRGRPGRSRHPIIVCCCCWPPEDPRRGG